MQSSCNIELNKTFEETGEKIRQIKTKVAVPYLPCGSEMGGGDALEFLVFIE